MLIVIDKEPLRKTIQCSSMIKVQTTREKFIAFSDSATLRRIETLARSWPTYRALT